MNEQDLGLRGEVEYHVSIHRHEVRCGKLNALDDLVGATVLVVAVHLLEQAIVEALHADRKALHTTLELLEDLGNQMVRVRLARDLLDAEQVTRLVDGRAQLVDYDSGRAASDVDAVEVVAQIVKHAHLLAHVLEIRHGALLREREAVERAVRA